MSLKSLSSIVLVSLLGLLALSIPGCQDSPPEIIVKRNFNPCEHHLFEDPNRISFTDPKTKLMGYKDKKGHIVIRPQFIMASEFTEFGIAHVFFESTKWRPFTIDKTGKVLLENFLFDNGADYYCNGLSRFVKNGKIGFIDRKANIVIPAQFEWVTGFVFNVPVAVVGKGCKYVDQGAEYPTLEGGKFGLINQQGGIIVPIEFDIEYMKNGTPLLIKENRHYQVVQIGDTYKTKEIVDKNPSATPKLG
ncbi:MAG: WG repeat-containing protein [Alphaproteobacteria bacterium]